MRNSLRVIFAVALVLLALSGIGGGAVSAAGTGSIAGSVYIDGTTTPLDGQAGRPLASITVYDSSWTWVGHDNMGPGGYSVTGLGTGDYYVMAEASGYYREYYDNATLPGGATKVSVTDGSATVGRDFYLAPGRSIRGTVYDNATNPIGHAWVEVDDNTTGLPRSSAYTADNGTFTITVAPGTYAVWSNAPGYAKEYYNNQPNFASANMVVLGTDNDTTGIDFSLGTSASITGHVFAEDNSTPVVGARVTAFTTIGGEASYGVSSSDNGSYFINLPAGQYRIVAVSTGRVAQWWQDQSVASEPATAADALPSWALGTWVTVTADNQTSGCDFRTLPKQAVATEPAVGVTITAATLMGSLTSMGGSDNVNVYFQWGTDNTLVGATSTTAVPMTSTGSFSASVTSGLSPNTTYYYRAVAAGQGHAGVSGVTTYGEPLTFTTGAVGVAAVTTDAEDNVTTTSAVLNGNLTSLGTAASVTVSFEYGTTTAYGSTTTGVSENATGAFSATVTGLTPDTLYHFRAAAVGDGAPVNGADRTFTTLGTAPAVTTDNASAVGTASAVLKGTLTSLGTEASVNVSFEWKVANGIWAETAVQTLTATGDFTANLTGLNDGTTYTFRAKADGYGTPVYGAENSFTTTAVDRTPPVVSGLAPSEETTSSATIKWTTDEAATSQVEYGLTEEYGQTTAEDTNLATSHSVELSKLEAGKTYHFRVISRDAANNETISGDMTLDTKASSGGVPVWGWVLIGLAAVAVAGGGAVLLLRGRAPKQPV